MQKGKQSGHGGPFVLTIDIGSSSLRVALHDALAQPVDGCKVQVAYAARVTPDGGVEIDPEELMQKLFSAIDEALKLAGDRGRQIAGVGMDTLVSNVLGVDKGGKPTTPIYTWADTRCASEARHLRATLDETEIHNRTGCHIHTSYLPPRLMWLKQHHAGAYSRTATWLTMGDLMQLRLFGGVEQSVSVASWSGLLNRKTHNWDTEWLSYLQLPAEKLPEIVDVDKPMSGLQAEFASRWPQLRDVPWYPAVGDGVASNLGSGCWGPERVAVQVGTSGAMRVMVPAEPGKPLHVPWGLWSYSAGKDAWLLGGALSEGGNLLAWLNSTLRSKDREALEAEASSMAPDSHGLTVLPFIAGERSPGWNPSARATFSGLTLSTSPASILRAAQEAVAYRFGLIYDKLCAAIPPPEMVIASGAALLNVPGWVGMLADVLGVPVTASGEEEASSRGAAMPALRALGVVDGYATLPQPLKGTYQPNMQNHDIYKEATRRQEKLYKAMEGTW